MAAIIVCNAFYTGVFIGFAERLVRATGGQDWRRAIMSATGPFIGTQRVRYSDVSVDNPTVHQVI